MQRAQWIVFAGLIAGLLTAGSALAQTPEGVQCPGASPSRLRLNTLAVVTPGLPPVNVRVAPGFRADRLGTLKEQVSYRVIDGPACANQHLWWQISSADVSGWVVEGQDNTTYLTPYEMPAFATAHDGVVEVRNNGFAFQFDSALAPAVGASPVRAITPAPDPNDGMPEFVAPDGLQFTFFDGTQNDIYPRSRLTFYRADGFRALLPAQGDKIDALRALIADETASENAEIPEVPGHNAAQMIRASIKYLTLPDGGKGVRYLTYYAQASVPATNGSLFYAFRGFSGVSYIHLEYAVDASVLPDRLTGGYWGENDFHNYGSHVTGMLTDLPDDQYTPNLALLDALVQTISTANG